MIASIPSQEATRLLIDWSNGNREAAAGLMPLVYEELRQRARAYLQRERPDHTLQATALVHETSLQLVERPTATWKNRAHQLHIRLADQSGGQQGVIGTVGSAHV